MRPVQIAELKNQLSAYLNLVRAGEEVLIRDRAVPIAKIVPLDQNESDLEEQSLVAQGLLRLPKTRFKVEEFLSVGRTLHSPKLNPGAIQRAVDFAREDASVGILGHKRRRSPVRRRAKDESR